MPGIPGIWAGSELDTCALRSRWSSQAQVALSYPAPKVERWSQQAVQPHLGAMDFPFHVCVPGHVQGPSQTPAAPGVGSARREAWAAC